MTEFEARPPTVAVAPAAVAGGIALLAVVAAPAALAVGVAAVALLVRGANTGRRRLVTVGGGVLFAAVVLAGVLGVDPGLALVAGVGSLVAYDAGEHAVSLAHDVGRDARVGQAVLVHVASTASLSLVVAALAYVIYNYGPSSLPMTALLTLLLAGTLLAFALRD